MSAEALRRAASLMRERANEAEQPGYRSDKPGQPWCQDWTYTVVRHVDRNLDAECPKHGEDPEGECNTWGRYAGAHISGMTPAVALAVADWLDLFADYHETGENAADETAAALAVARAYLGGTT